MDEEVQNKRQSTFPLFSKYFSTHPINVVEYSHLMRKQMEDFIDAFRKRIDVQNTYAKNLMQVSKVLDKYIKPGTQLSISFICSAFKVEHEQRSRQATQLSESLKTQIQIMCLQMSKNHTVAIKKMEKDVKKYYKQAQSCLQNYESSLQHFEGISKQMQQMIITKNIMRFTSGIPQQKKVKLISKTMQSIKNNKQYQKLYLGSVKDYNTFVSNYNKQITIQLDQAQTMLREQVVMQADCLRKLIVAEVSMFKNIQYDLLNISKQMEHLDTQKEIEIFVEEQKNSSQNKVIKQQRQQKQGDARRVSLGSIDSDSYNIYKLKVKKILGKSLLSQSLLYVQEEYFSYMMSNKKNKKLRQLLGKIWKHFKNYYNKNNKEITQNNNLLIEKQSNEIAASQKLMKNQQNIQKETTTQQKAGINQFSNNNQQSNSFAQTQQTNEVAMSKQEENEWEIQLKDMINNFKIVQPPVFILYTSEKSEKKPTPQIIYQKFMYIVNTVALLWNSEQIQGQLLNSILKSLEEILALHHLYRLMAFMFIQEYRLQHQVIIKSPQKAKVCGKIIKAVLKQSQQYTDVFIIRGLLGLIFTYYWAEDKNKKLLFLSPQIYYLDIWKKLDFWQAAIFQTTFEQMSLFTYQKNQTPSQTVLREKNIIFSQLASYCHYMVMLGITTKNVRLIVGRYCRLYEMTQQQNKDLSKMITNTQKQYKQTAIQFSLKQLQKQKSNISE